MMASPRLPRRPEPYQSDWSPRPIPQAVEPLRTADPPTPTLKELAERERQRASLTGGAAPTRATVEPRWSPEPAHPPCVATGLATQASADAYKAGMQQLWQNWTKLTSDERVERIQAVLNEQLSHGGVPAVTVRRSTSLGSADGQFVAYYWRLDVNARLLGKDQQPISDRDFNNLTKTAYHEARHAEQQYLIARARASSGEPPASFASGMLMNGPAAQAAAQDPLPLLGTEYVVPPAAVQYRPQWKYPAPVADPDPNAGWADRRGACAARWDDSVFGSGQAPREELLADLRTNKPQAVNRAAAALDEARKEHADRRTLDALARVWHAADADYRTTQRAYAALPEEADAFATEELLHLR